MSKKKKWKKKKKKKTKNKKKKTKKFQTRKTNESQWKQRKTRSLTIRKNRLPPQFHPHQRKFWYNKMYLLTHRNGCVRFFWFWLSFHWYAVLLLSFIFHLQWIQVVLLTSIQHHIILLEDNILRHQRNVWHQFGKQEMQLQKPK